MNPTELNNMFLILFIVVPFTLAVGMGMAWLIYRTLISPKKADTDIKLT